MQWTPEGAHLLLQIRACTLNGDLAATFRQWYPLPIVRSHSLPSGVRGPVVSPPCHSLRTLA
jgi:hypothetical protein